MQALSSDLEGRYAEGENDIEGHVKKRYYQGQKYISPIENYATDLMKSLFKCDWADVRIVSARMQTLRRSRVIVGCAERKMVVLPKLWCTHFPRLHRFVGQRSGWKTYHVYNIDELNIDVDRSIDVIRAAKPGIVTFGVVFFSFLIR